MNNYHIVYQGEGWAIKGAQKSEIYNTKKRAIEQAKSIAIESGKSLIIHSQDGKISSVITNGRRFAKGQRIKSANVKHRLKTNAVRKSIAKAMSERRVSE